LTDGCKLKEPVEGPNIWRVYAGDRIVWVGKKRGGVEFDNGVLGLIDFRQNALVYGEPLDLSSTFPSFGGFEHDNQSVENIRICRVGWNALNQLGLLRVFATGDNWTLG
jgi:hypothetical protein